MIGIANRAIPPMPAANSQKVILPANAVTPRGLRGCRYMVDAVFEQHAGTGGNDEET